jgi:site-specific DNA-cytosine methylase
MLWFTKSRRAQNDIDYETWIEGGVVPTMNGFDNGDIRTTTVILMRQREGKPGGGKGPLMSEDKSLTLATGNDQTLFVFHPHRSDGVRLQGKTVSTLTAYMGTGGLNTPMVATSEVRRLTPTECERLQGFPDGWTEGQSDTHRYKQLGNAVAVPVVDWLIRGITMLD